MTTIIHDDQHDHYNNNGSGNNQPSEKQPCAMRFTKQN